MRTKYQKKVKELEDQIEENKKYPKVPEFRQANLQSTQHPCKFKTKPPDWSAQWLGPWMTNFRSKRMFFSPKSFRNGVKQMALFPGIIHPFSKARLILQAIYIVSINFTICLRLFIIMSNWEYPSYVLISLHVIYNFFIILQMLDVFFCFRCGFVKQGVVVLDKYTIMSNYIKKSLIFDILSLFPLKMIHFIFREEGSGCLEFLYFLVSDIVLHSLCLVKGFRYINDISLAFPCPESIWLTFILLMTILFTLTCGTTLNLIAATLEQMCNQGLKPNEIWTKRSDIAIDAAIAMIAALGSNIGGTALKGHPHKPQYELTMRYFWCCVRVVIRFSQATIMVVCFGQWYYSERTVREWDPEHLFGKDIASMQKINELYYRRYDHGVWFETQILNWIRDPNQSRVYAQRARILLEGQPLLDMMTQEQRSWFGNRVTEDPYPSRQVLFLQDGPASNVFCLIYGRVELTRVKSDGVFKVTMRGRQIFGLHSLVRSAKWTVTAIALEHCLCLRMKRRRFNDFLRLTKYQFVGEKLFNDFDDLTIEFVEEQIYY